MKQVIQDRGRQSQLNNAGFDEKKFQDFSKYFFQSFNRVKYVYIKWNASFHIKLVLEIHFYISYDF